MANKTAPKPVQRRGPAPEKTVEIDSATAALIFFGIALVYFLPALMPGRHIYGSDYIEAGYMMYEFARERIVSGSLPKWVPYILGGLPMFANPGSVFYPLRLLTNFLLPGTMSLPIIFIFQFGIAGFGMYLLARELGCRTWAAFIAGIAFQLTGITISAVYAGHDGRVIVATFAPLFLFFLHRGIRTGSFAAFAGAATTLGFSLLSFQIQSNYYVLLAGAAWATFLLVHLGIIRTPRALATRTALGLGAVAFAFAIAAVNFLPFRDYVADSPRGAARGYTYSTTWSLPPAELVGMAVPEHVGVFDAYKGKNPFKINTEYVGAFVLVLLVLGFAVSRRNRYWWFFLGVMAVTLTIAMGGHTPIYRLYYEILPGTKRFRAPSVSFFLIALSLAAMAALTLERIAQMYDERKGTGKGRDIVSWLLAAIAGTVIAVSVIASVTQGFGGSPGAATGFGRFAIFAVLLCLAMWLWWS
ncbi:MAG TPA: 6-pyruvoyl-tetrahydropterin synthase-related protein, partial [Longimicrobiales bacterium]